MSRPLHVGQYPALGTSGFPRQVSFQRDGGCLRPGAPRPMAASDSGPVDVLPALAFDGRIHANPPSWDEPYHAKLTELHAKGDQPDEWPATDFTSTGVEEPKIWKVGEKSPDALEHSQGGVWAEPWYPTTPKYFYYQRPRGVQTRASGHAWNLPCLLLVPTPDGDVLEFDFRYNPSHPMYVNGKYGENVYLQELAYWESNFGKAFGDWYRVYVARSWMGTPQAADVGYRSAALGPYGENSKQEDANRALVLKALKALAVSMGLDIDSADDTSPTNEKWKAWFMPAFAACSLVLLDSPQLVEFHELFPPPGGAPLTKAGVAIGHVRALMELLPDVEYPLTLAHSPCGMCPVSQTEAHALDPGRVLISGDGWGVGDGLTFNQKAYSIITDGGVVTKTDADGNVTVDGVLQTPGGLLPPEPEKSGVGAGVLALGALGLGLLLLRRG